MENESTHGLRLDQLAGLLSLGAEEPDSADTAGHDQRMAGLLREQLSCVLPWSMLLFDALVMMMGRLGCDVRSLAGRFWRFCATRSRISICSRPSRTAARSCLSA
jgi:hypothetical protein